MDIEEAIELALSGNSILFTGAGFSIDATNLRGSSFKTAAKLSEFLSGLAGIEEKLSLDAAAEEYISVNGKDGLINELHNEFTAKTVTSAHSQIAEIPWKRIYTTNYDNVLEKAYAEVGKKLSPIVSSDNIRNIPLNKTVCVHLNGWIDGLDRSTLMSEFKLTETSYLTTSIENSPWGTLFRDDIKSARSVFFVGYSLADLDIHRLLIESDSLREKCFFILGASPSQRTIRICSTIGQVTSLDTSSFAKLTKEISDNFVPNTLSEFVSTSIEKYQAPKEDLAFSDKDIFSLFLQGKINETFVADSLTGDRHYFLERPEINKIIEQLKFKTSVYVVTSELGNGKSLLIEGVKFHAYQAGFSIYELSENSNDILEHIDNIFKDTSRKIIIIENYTDWMEQIRHIADISDDRCSLVLTSRTTSHDINIDRLSGILNSFEINELSVDKLSDGDLLWITKTFDEYGLWGRYTSRSSDHKLEILSTDCEREFQGILLELLKSPDIVSRLETIINGIKQKKDYYLVVITILILNVLNKVPTINRLADFWKNLITDPRFQQDILIRELLDFNKGTVVLKSSVTARHILREIVDIETIVDILIKLVRTSNSLSKATQYHFEVKNLLVRFSTLQELLPDIDKKRNEVIRYYESIKGLNTINDYPLFWMQYAIACEVLGEFAQAEKYFETAYSLAENRLNFDTFQIDNRYAEFLINRAIKQKREIVEAMSDFVEAHKLLYRQARKERLYFPFKVASLYEGFFDTYSDLMHNKHKEIVQQAASDMITKIHELPRERKLQWHIRRCESILTTLLEKTSGIIH